MCRWEGQQQRVGAQETCGRQPQHSRTAAEEAGRRTRGRAASPCTHPAPALAPAYSGYTALLACGRCLSFLKLMPAAALGISAAWADAHELCVLAAHLRAERHQLAPRHRCLQLLRCLQHAGRGCLVCCCCTHRKAPCSCSCRRNRLCWCCCGGRRHHRDVCLSCCCIDRDQRSCSDCGELWSDMAKRATCWPGCACIRCIVCY